MTDVVSAWKTDSGDLPNPLSDAKETEILNVIGTPKTNITEILQDTRAPLQFAFAINKSIGKNKNYRRLKDLLNAGQHLKQALPWIESFDQPLKVAQEKAIKLQGDALLAFENSDSATAEAKLREAATAYPSPVMDAYVNAFAVLAALLDDKALRAIDSNIKSITLPDISILEKASITPDGIAAADDFEISKEFRNITKGFEAASLLLRFTRQYEKSGDKDESHPLKASAALKKIESYERLKNEDSVFSKRILSRLKEIDEMIAPKLTEFESLNKEALAFEKENKYLKAAATYRKMLAIEPSRDLEKAISRCESKTSGL
jgi:hypothetical protein